MAIWKQLHVLLPDGWYEVPGERPRQYRRAAAGSGVLTLGMVPPFASLASVRNDDELDDALLEQLAEAADASDAGEPLSCWTGPCTYGRFATGLFKNAGRGKFVRLWILAPSVGSSPPDSTPGVIANFVSSRRPVDGDDSDDAQSIVESVELRDSEPRL